MSSLIADPQTPEELARLADQPRVLVRRGGAPRKDGMCVVYWMQRAMRIVDNPAFDVAIAAANLLHVPVVIYFQVIPNYPHANLRHFYFLQQALRDVAEDAAARELTFIVRRSRPGWKRSLKKCRPRSSSATKTLAANRNAGARHSPAASGSLTGPWTPTSWCPLAFLAAALRCSITFGHT